MAYDVPQLLKMSQAQLDALFTASAAGKIPNGEAQGTAKADRLRAEVLIQGRAKWTTRTRPRSSIERARASAAAKGLPMGT
jgi:hypothetical protein